MYTSNASPGYTEPKPINDGRVNFAYNTANEKSYQDIMSGYRNQLSAFESRMNNVNQSYTDMVRSAQGIGESDRLNLMRQYDQQAAAQQASLVSRGLGNTSVLDANMRAVDYDRTLAAINLGDVNQRRILDIQNQQLGMQAQMAGQYAQMQGGMMNFDQQALQQRYGAEAGYLSQYDLQNQQGRLGLQNQTQLNYQNAMNQQMLAQQQQQFQDYMSSKYGYY